MNLGIIDIAPMIIRAKNKSLVKEVFFNLPVFPVLHEDTTRFGALAAGTALLVALIAFLAWLVRAGSIINYISESVMVGCKCGVALFLASTQLPKLFGIHGTHENFWVNSGNFLNHLGDTNIASLAVGGVALALLVLGKIFLKNKPVALFVVVGGILASGWFGLEARELGGQLWRRRPRTFARRVVLVAGVRVVERFDQIVEDSPDCDGIPDELGAMAVEPVRKVRGREWCPWAEGRQLIHEVEVRVGVVDTVLDPVDRLVAGGSPADAGDAGWGWFRSCRAGLGAQASGWS